jgi:hypothetical protein
VRRPEEPDDRLTRIADAAANAARNHPEFRAGDRVFVSASDYSENEVQSGAAAFGFGSEIEVVYELLEHVAGLAQSSSSVHVMKITQSKN